MFQNRPGNRHTLFLATGEFQPPLADKRLIAFWQARNKAVNRGQPGRLPDLRLIRPLPAIADIIGR